MFKYELAPFPMSLFTDEGMHKGTKIKLYDTFLPIVDKYVNFGTSKCNIINGGFLLHRVVWNKMSEATFKVVSQSSVDYIQRHFGSTAIVVFRRGSHHHNNGRCPKTTASHDQLQVQDWLYLCNLQLQKGWTALYYNMQKLCGTSCQNSPQPDTNEADTDDESVMIPVNDDKIESCSF